MTTTNRFDQGRGRRWLPLLALAGFGLFGGACDRTHLSSYYGRSFNTWFAMQHVHEDAPQTEQATRALGSLDSQEATAVSKSYRRAFGGTQNEGQGQMVMVGQARGGGEPYTPPPSVPSGQ
jgi:hypothetical protein